MSLYDSEVASKAEALALAQYRQGLKTRTNTAEVEDSRIGEIPEYRRVAERFVYRPTGSIATNHRSILGRDYTYHSEANGREHAKHLKAVATYEAESQRRFAQRRKAGKVRQRPASW